MNDAYWADMEKMIETDEKGNDRKFLWTWLLGALFLVMIVGGLFWFMGTGTDSSVDKTMTDTQIAPRSEQTQTSTNLLEENKTTQSERKDELEEASSNNEVVISANGNQDDVPSKIETAAKSVSESNNVISNNPINKTTPSKYENSSNENSFEKRKATVNSFTPPTIVLPKETEKEILSNPTKNETPKKQILKQQPTPPTIKKVEPKKEAVARKPIAGILNIPSLDLYAEGKEEELPDLEWMNIKKKKFSLGLTAGTVSFPFDQNASNTIQGSKFGLTVRYKLRGNLALNADLMYYYRGGNYNPVESTSETTYSFGRMTDRYELTPENLHYFDMPIYLTYSKKKHVFEGGVSASYLLGVRGATIKKPHEGQIVAVDDPHWIENTGFKNVLTNVALGYRYQLTPNLHFGVRGVYSFGNLISNSDDTAMAIGSPEREIIGENSPLHLTFKLTQYLF